MEPRCLDGNEAKVYGMSKRYCSACQLMPKDDFVWLLETSVARTLCISRLVPTSIATSVVIKTRPKNVECGRHAAQHQPGLLSGFLGGVDSLKTLQQVLGSSHRD